MYLRSKAAGEAALQQAGLAVTILRPSVIFGAGDRFLNLFAQPAGSRSARAAGGRDGPVPAGLGRRRGRSHRARASTIPPTAGQTFECAGPRVYTLAELVRLAGRWSGHPRPVSPLPDALGRIQARIMEWLPGEPLMSRDNLRSMQVPNVASGLLPGLEKLGITATDIEAVGPLMLGAGDEAARRNHWRAAAHHG